MYHYLQLVFFLLQNAPNNVCLYCASNFCAASILDISFNGWSHWGAGEVLGLICARAAAQSVCKRLGVGAGWKRVFAARRRSAFLRRGLSWQWRGQKTSCFLPSATLDYIQKPTLKAHTYPVPPAWLTSPRGQPYFSVLSCWTEDRLDAAEADYSISSYKCYYNRGQTEASGWTHLSRDLCNINLDFLWGHQHWNLLTFCCLPDLTPRECEHVEWSWRQYFLALTNSTFKRCFVVVWKKKCWGSIMMANFIFERCMPSGSWLNSKGAFTPKAKLFFASPKTREFTRSTICRVLAISVETLREGRGLSPYLVSVKTVIISFIHQNNSPLVLLYICCGHPTH